MVKTWKHRRSGCPELSIVYIIWIITSVQGESCRNVSDDQFTGVDRQLKEYIDQILSTDTYNVVPGLRIERSLSVVQNATKEEEANCGESRAIEGIGNYFQEKLKQYYDTHLVSVNLPETARFFFKGDILKSNSKPGSTSFELF